ncbi:unnamed protein product [Durusdinium trenchii]|uniref:Uncharacterized protein n=1 Tax=Durusdinium trenchii TaxID=1381693 RepID=A0ABP0KXJ0_9DINO
MFSWILALLGMSMPALREGKRRRSKRSKSCEERKSLQREVQAKRIEREVQGRIVQKLGAKEFENTIQEKIQQEIERHYSLVKIEMEIKKKKLIEEFQQQRDQEERSKQELEAIIRTNQQRMQEQQQRVAQELGSQADELWQERGLLQKRQEQRRKALLKGLED